VLSIITATGELHYSLEEETIRDAASLVEIYQSIDFIT